MRRREFITLVGGAAAWPMAARAQQNERVRRIGVLVASPADDAEWKARLAAFNDGLAQLIVDMWTGAHPNLITPATNPAQYQARSVAAKAVLAARGIYLEQPILITEDEYEEGFNLLDAGLTATNGVVFVLPRIHVRRLLVGRLCLRRLRC